MELCENGEIPWIGTSHGIGIYKDYVGSGARGRKSCKIMFFCKIPRFMSFSRKFIKFHENEWKRWICITTTPTCPEPYIFLVVSYVFWSFAWAGNLFFHKNPEKLGILAFFKKIMKILNFMKNDGNSRNSTNPGPQNLQNRAVIHTVSGVAARGGARNHNFHKSSWYSMRFHEIFTFSWIFIKTQFSQVFTMSSRSATPAADPKKYLVIHANSNAFAEPERRKSRKSWKLADFHAIPSFLVNFTKIFWKSPRKISSNPNFF